MPRPFFVSTVGALDEVVRLFDFVWPTAAAMWNLRWQVQGYEKNRDGCTEKELAERFLTGSDNLIG